MCRWGTKPQCDKPTAGGDVVYLTKSPGEKDGAGCEKMVERLEDWCLVQLMEGDHEPCCIKLILN